MARFGLPSAWVILLLWTQLAAGQNLAEPALANAPFRIVQSEGRELIVLPPYRPAPGANRSEQPDAGGLAVQPGAGGLAVQPGAGGLTVQPGAGGLAVQSYETASRRLIAVSLEGETFRAAAPLAGPGSLLVFDPARRAFAELSPTIRVELGEGLDVDAAAAAVGATGVEVFESLGFAILTLPRGLHPADAVTVVRNLTGQPGAAVRLRAPRIQWR